MIRSKCVPNTYSIYGTRTHLNDCLPVTSQSENFNPSSRFCASLCRKENVTLYDSNVVVKGTE